MNYCSLTFDDGPNLAGDDTMNKMLDVLEKHGVVASFFLIANKITPENTKVIERAVALGCDIEIEALNGKKVLIKIPSGTSNGKLLRVRGEGVPSAGGLRNGDLYVKIMVQIPQHLSSKQKDLLKAFMELENPTENPKLMPLSQLEQ